jgi:hypothetical protein
MHRYLCVVGVCSVFLGARGLKARGAFVWVWSRPLWSRKHRWVCGPVGVVLGCCDVPQCVWHPFKLSSVVPLGRRRHLLWLWGACFSLSMLTYCTALCCVVLCCAVLQVHYLVALAPLLSGLLLAGCSARPQPTQGALCLAAVRLVPPQRRAEACLAVRVHLRPLGMRSALHPQPAHQVRFFRASVFVCRIYHLVLAQGVGGCGGGGGSVAWPTQGRSVWRQYVWCRPSGGRRLVWWCECTCGPWGCVQLCTRSRHTRYGFLGLCVIGIGVRVNWAKAKGTPWLSPAIGHAGDLQWCWGGTI